MHGRMSPGSRAEAQLWRKLMTAWNRDHVALSREIALNYTRLYADNVSGWIVLADVLASLALHDQAKAALRKAQALAPVTALPQIWIHWGNLYEKQGARARASTWYGKAVKVRPETGSLVLFGASLAMQGKFRDAKRSYRQAIKAGGPRCDEAYYTSKMESALRSTTSNARIKGAGASEKRRPKRARAASRESCGRWWLGS